MKVQTGALAADYSLGAADEIELGDHLINFLISLAGDILLLVVHILLYTGSHSFSQAASFPDRTQASKTYDHQLSSLQPIHSHGNERQQTS